jgi:hypothetical protein
MNLFNGIQDRDVSILMMAWAEHHPYLFTLIKVLQPTLIVVIAVVGSNIVSKIIRSSRSSKRF